MIIPKLLRLDWVFLDSAAKQFVCRRCKASQPLEATGIAESLIWQMRQFQNKHKRCKEKPL